MGAQVCIIGCGDYNMKVTAGLLLAGALLFGSSINHPFHFDDTLITNDSNVTNPARWAHFLNPLHLRQVTFFTFYLNNLVGGANPAGYHLVNVAIHIANACLLFYLLEKFVGQWVAAGAAALFMLHPIQTEAVLYIYERSTLLACFFSLLGLIALVEKRNWLAAGLFFLAFESKEAALAVPLAVALLGKRERGLKPAATYWIVAVVVLFGAITLGLLEHANEPTVGIGAAGQVHPLRYLLTETRVVFTYLRLLFFPHPQSLEYDIQNAGGVLSAVGVVLLLLLGWQFRRTIPGLCILAFFILLAPTSSIIPSADAAFEHRLYLPMLAFSVLIAFLISKIPQRTSIGVALVMILAILTVRREDVWASDISLWEDTVQHAPGKARAWFNLGGAYLNTDPDKSRAALLHALSLQPHFPEALYDLGLIEQGKGNWSGALAFYDRAVDQQPDYWPAWNNMGNTLSAMGQNSRALEYFERTLRLNPDYWPAQYNIAIVSFTSGRYTESVYRLRTVLEWRPDFREARTLLAISLTRTGDRTAADQEWKKLGETNAAESRYTPTMILAPNRP